MSDYQDTTFYLQVEPEWGMYRSANGDLQLVGAKAARITQKQPDPPKGGSVVVKLTVRVPSSALLPLRPPVVEVPEDRIEIVVTAEEQP
jgi:hypothetical protein